MPPHPIPGRFGRFPQNLRIGIPARNFLLQSDLKLAEQDGDRDNV